jgi:NAD(P)-dependent dehydrogenase (short-subunit alcohol dehydrogenase family)
MLFYIGTMSAHSHNQAKPMAPPQNAPMTGHLYCNGPPLHATDKETIKTRHKMARLSGKTALVIGAGTVDGGWGNGKACAMQFAREGAKVVCVDLDGALAKETAQIIRDEGYDAIGITANATISADMKRAVDLAVETYGRLDILLNNVGIVVRGGVVDLSEDDWDRAFNVNLKSAYLSMKHAIPAMIKTGGGSITNISSISSLKYLNKPYVAYYATKAAMNHMTRVTAAQYASDQIRVNAILPGLMDTPMAKASAEKNWGATPEKMAEYWKARAAQVPMGWLGDAFDIAKAAVFFSSEDARWVTGQSLVVDGGTTLS